MRIYALDPARFKSYLDEGLCPNCGHKVVDGDTHMQKMPVMGGTWGCYIVGNSTPVRAGILAGK